MRSQTFLRKSHHILNHSTVAHTIQPSVQCSSRVLHYERFKSVANGVKSCRYSSSSSNPTPTLEPEEEVNLVDRMREITLASNARSNVATADTANPGAEEPEKSSKTRRTRLASSKEGEGLEFPEGLEDTISYVSTESIQGTHGGLPPPEIFEEALDNLMIALHPQNQHRAIHPSNGSARPVEPTLGLYCPIEGGDYVIDLTVQELAFQTGAEVLVLDGAQLAAEEWGVFGKGMFTLCIQPPVRLKILFQRLVISICLATHCISWLLQHPKQRSILVNRLKGIGLMMMMRECPSCSRQPECRCRSPRFYPQHPLAP